MEPLLGVIREQGEWPFRHKGAGSKGQISQGSRENENCNQGAWSTISVTKKAAESKSRPLNRPIFTNRRRYAAGWLLFFNIFIGSVRQKIREHSKNWKGAGSKVK